MRRRPLIVDAHCHIIVPEMLTSAVPSSWRPAISSDGDRQLVRFRGQTLNSATGEFTDVDVMLAQAAAAGVDHLVLSPWIMLVPVAAGLGEALEVCRVQNEALSRWVTGRPLSALGAVPLQDAATAARELTRLMRLPGICGAEVPASVRGAGLGDDRFLPFWEAAEETGAMIFVHPAARGLGLPGLDVFYLWNSVGSPLETTVAAAQLIAAGVLRRFPGLRILLAHGGGALPALRGRLRRAHAVRPEARARSAVGPDLWLRRFYFDSVTHDRAVLGDLVSFAGAEHVLLGSDRPFDMGSENPAQEVRALGLGAAEQLVLGGNACRLLGVAGS